MTTLLIGFKPGVLTGAQLDCVREAAPAMRLIVTPDPGEIETILDDVEIATARVPTALLERAPRLRWFQAWGAGTDWLLSHPELIKRDLVVTNTSGIHPIQMTEHVLMLILALARRLADALRAQGRHTWRHMENTEVSELAGKTLLLIGLGAIGQRAARLAACLGMRVLAVRRRAAEPAAGVEAVFGPHRLPDLLPAADFVVLVAPLTAETHHLIAARELALMKPTAFLVNVGRGGLVDEAALISALQEGRIAGAGLDVFEAEPLPADSPLWEMPNVIITGHYGGVSPEYDHRAFDVFLDNLRRYQAGQPLRNVVDKGRGY